MKHSIGRILRLSHDTDSHHASLLCLLSLSVLLGCALQGPEDIPLHVVKTFLGKLEHESTISEARMKAVKEDPELYLR